MKDTEIRMEEVGAQKFVDHYWDEIMKIKTPIRQMWLTVLAQVMVAVVSLPHNNADCERAFSVVRKVHTECRQNLNADTLTLFIHWSPKMIDRAMSYMYQRRWWLQQNVLHMSTTYSTSKVS